MLVGKRKIMQKQTIDAGIFKDGDVVVFFGDSITHGGRYHEFITDYYRTRFPEADIRFVNSGIGGDNAAAALPRIDVDVKEYAPTHVSFHFGMNDVGRGVYKDTPTEEDLELSFNCQKKYQKNIDILTKKVREIAPAAKFMYLTTTPYDDTAIVTEYPPGTSDWAQINQKGCSTGLSIMAGGIIAKAKADGAGYVNWYTPLQNFLMGRRRNDPYFMITRIDRVHPMTLAHSIMAWEFLLAQGAPAVVSDVAVDAANATLVKNDNAEVADVVKSDSGVSFTVLAKSLPFPIDPEALPYVEEFGIEDKLNLEVLAVNGLKSGKYSLKIDGEVVGQWTAEEFASGIKLGFNDKTPQYKQAQQLFETVKALSDKERIYRNHHAARWFYGMRTDVDDLPKFAEWFDKNVENKNEYFAGFVPGYLKYWPTYKESRAALLAEQQEARKLAKPVSRKYELLRS